MDHIEGRYQEAEAEINKLLALAPDLVSGHLMHGLHLMYRGRTEEALPSLRQAVAISNSPPVKGMLGWAYGEAGYTAQAREILDELKEKDASPVSLAYVFSGLGELDDAFFWMEKAIQLRDPGLGALLFKPQFDRLRKDVRFRRIASRMGLPDAPWWLKTGLQGMRSAQASAHSSGSVQVPTARPDGLQVKEETTCFRRLSANSSRAAS